LERSVTIVATMRYLVHKGWPVLRLNLRGTLLSQATSTGRYHAGKTEDLAAALHQSPTELRRHGVVLLGHSLGGNLVLKLMGEGCHGLPVLAAIAVSAPLDLAASRARMLSRRNLAYHAYLRCQTKREALVQGAADLAVYRLLARPSIKGFRPGRAALRTGAKGVAQVAGVKGAENRISFMRHSDG
jgi:uncharacterized protein